MKVLTHSFREKSNQHENHDFKVTDFLNELKKSLNVIFKMASSFLIPFCATRKKLLLNQETLAAMKVLINHDQLKYITLITC